MSFYLGYWGALDSNGEDKHPNTLAKLGILVKNYLFSWIRGVPLSYLLASGENDDVLFYLY